VPFVDVLTTILDDTLPLTPPEWPEWGNPILSVADYHSIAAYSPYDNVKNQAYPAILAIAGLTDPRVTYWEPAKWVAKLREHNTGNTPVMLKTNMSAGHGGASGRFFTAGGSGDQLCVRDQGRSRLKLRPVGHGSSMR
jgi:oligopeptidase B